MEFCKGTCPRAGPDGPEDRRRLRPRSGLSRRAAGVPRAGRGDRADRLLARRPQHQRRVRLHRARAAAAAVPGSAPTSGIALDGDGDRVVMVDRQGRVVDGDQLLYVMASWPRGARELGGPVVGTVMSNLGLELALRRPGHRGSCARAVGDRYVLARLRRAAACSAAETSGHILCLDQHHHRRRPDQRASGAGDHEADRPLARRSWPPVWRASRRRC